MTFVANLLAVVAFVPGLPAAVYALLLAVGRLFARIGRGNPRIMLVKARTLGIRQHNGRTVVDLDSGAEDGHIVTVPFAAGMLPKRESIFDPPVEGRFLVFNRTCFGADIAGELHFHPWAAAELSELGPGRWLVPAANLFWAWAVWRLFQTNAAIAAEHGTGFVLFYSIAWVALTAFWAISYIVRVSLLKRRLAAGLALLERGWQYSPPGEHDSP